MRKAKHLSRRIHGNHDERQGFLPAPKVEIAFHMKGRKFNSMRVLADGPMPQLSKKEIRKELKALRRAVQTPELARLNWLKTQVEKMDDSKEREKLLRQIDKAMEGTLVISVKVPKEIRAKKEMLHAAPSSRKPSFLVVLLEILPIIPAIAEAVKYLRTQIKKFFDGFEFSFEFTKG